MIGQIITIAIVSLLLLLVISKSTSSYDKCYSDMEYSTSIAAMGCCKGKTNSIGDLSETCTNCPYLVSLNDKEVSK